MRIRNPVKNWSLPDYMMAFMGVAAICMLLAVLYSCAHEATSPSPRQPAAATVSSVKPDGNATDVTGQYTLPAEMKDCKIFHLHTQAANPDMTVVHCPDGQTQSSAKPE